MGELGEVEAKPEEEFEDASAGGTKARRKFKGTQFSSQAGNFIEEIEEE